MPMPATYGMNSVAAYYGSKPAAQVTQADIKRAMQSAAAAKAERLAATQRQLADVQEYIRSGKALRDGNRQRAARASAARASAVKAAKAKTADEKAGEVISFGVEALGPVVAGVVFFGCLAAGPVGWLLLIVLAICAGSDSSSKRSRKPKVTGFYCPYYPSK